jgi:hypothetical protein
LVPYTPPSTFLIVSGLDNSNKQSTTAVHGVVGKFEQRKAHLV